MSLKEKLLEDIQVYTYESGEQFKDQLYCYYVFQNVIVPSQIPPNLFTDYVKGGSLKLVFIKDYNLWLENEDN